MGNLWIGDFRCKQLQYLLAGSSQGAFENTFMVDDNAESSWMTSTAYDKIAANATNGTNVIIMLGLNDCINSCTWDKLSLQQFADTYVNSINSLVSRFSSTNFYFCSVNPVDNWCPGTNFEGSLIEAETLNNTIELFNSVLRGKCSATFIDGYSYLKLTGFSTRDGLRYTQDTCLSLLEYISSYLKNSLGISFVPRLTAPAFGSAEDGDSAAEGDFWLSTQNGGLNPFPITSSYSKRAGDTLPNCTAYAWGRFYEITGSKPTLSLGNAEQWYLYTSDGYKRGQTPMVGAVICWQKGIIGDDPNVAGEDGGHVAIVEQINSDGSILISESGWDCSWYWKTSTIRKDSSGKWYYGSNYEFQGFIYCPVTTTAAKEDLCTKNSYAISIEEMKPNAQYIWQYFSARGWTLNAVAGMLGNIQQESKMSPGVWQNTVTDCETIDANGKHTLTAKGKNFSSGYGLTQWTPARKFFTWCNSGGSSGNANGTGKVLPYWEMDTQLLRIEAEVEASTGGWIEGLSQWIKNPSKGYDISFSEFITSTQDAYWLAGAFAFCYERPGRSTGTAAEQNALRKERGEYGDYWYNFLCGLPSVSVDARLHIKDVKVNCTCDSASVSFIARNAENAYYSLDNKKPQSINLANNFNLFNINDLAPNTEYKLKITATGANETETETEISFMTPQSIPENVTTVKIVAKDTKLPHDSIQLTINPTTPNFGYWKTTKGNEHGYAVKLIVNGNTLNEKIVNSLPTSIKLSDYFGYEATLSDIVQIGINTWVKDANGKRLFSTYTKASNPICMLSKPITAYINTNK